MKKIALSKTAAAVALGLASLGAHANHVEINFESLKQSILDTATSQAPATPVSVGTVDGFTFSGAWYRAGDQEIHLIAAHDTTCEPGWKDPGPGAQAGLAVRRVEARRPRLHHDRWRSGAPA